MAWLYIVLGVYRWSLREQIREQICEQVHEQIYGMTGLECGLVSSSPGLSFTTRSHLLSPWSNRSTPALHTFVLIFVCKSAWARKLLPGLETLRLLR